MRKLMLAALLLLSMSAFAQPAFYKADKIYSNQFYLKNVRIDSVSNDTNFTAQSQFNFATQYAIYKFVNSSIANNTVSTIAWTNITGKPTASGTTTGLLLASDWLGFNGKQDALNGTGLVRMSGTSVSYDNTSYLPLSGGILTNRLRGTSLILNKDSVPTVSGKLWALIIDTANGNIVSRQVMPTVSGTANYVPKYSSSSVIGNSSINDAGTGMVFNNNITATANGQTLWGYDFTTTFNSGGFSGITNRGIRFQKDVYIGSYLEQNSSSVSSLFYGYNELTAATGAASGSLLLGNNSATTKNGFAATYGGGGSKLTIFNQYVGGTTSQVVVALGGTERFVFNANSEFLVNTTTSTGDKINCNGSVRATQFKLSSLNPAPTSSTDTGTAGEVRITATYIYVCTATNTWVRSALSTF